MAVSYYISWRHSNVIAFDGMGPFDYAQPPFEKLDPKILKNPGPFDLPSIGASQDPIAIPARRGVSKFGLFADAARRFIVLNPSLRDLLSPCLVNAQPVTIVKGKSNWAMLAANLEILDMVERVDFEHCEFAVFDSSDLKIGFNRIAAGKLPGDYLTTPEQSGLRFESPAEYWNFVRARGNWLKSVIPVRLRTSLEELPPIVQFGSTDLFREDVTKAVGALARPGTFYPGAPVVIENET